VGKDDDNGFPRPGDDHNEGGGSGGAGDMFDVQSFTYHEYMKAVIIFVVALINMVRECTAFYRPKLKYILDTVNWYVDAFSTLLGKL